jgi:hypothetical protein
MQLTWLPSALRAAGLKVVEIDGWQTRGHGDMLKPRMVICHHTAEPIDANTEPSLGVLIKGRPDLAGPLCNLGLGQSGVFYMVAAGKAYHAGAGMWRGVRDGNENAVGIEAENNGKGEAWPKAQMDAYARGCAVIAKHCGFGSEMIAGHKEYALPKGRKSDPNFDMVAFRKSVAAFMKN